MDFIRRSALMGIALTAALAVGLPSWAEVPPDQITDDDSGSGCTSSAPVSDGAGTIAAWQSDCDPTGGNGDGSIEIFRATVGSAPVQLTAGSGCSSSRPSISADGSRVAFESSCNLLGTNADGNVEIFLWKNGTITQLTASTGCDNLAPSINGPGTFIAYDTTCNTSGTSNDGRGSEIFRVSFPGLVIQRLTTDPNGGACDSTSASISSNGNTVAFDSDCNLTGENEDLAIEIFTVSASNLAVSQRTLAPDDSCSSVRPSIDAAGSVIGFYSDCDFIGSNVDHSDEIFTVDSALHLRQITNVGAAGACASGEPHMASSGHALVFSSYCGLNGSNPDGSVEVFQAGVGDVAGGILAVSDAGGGCSSAGGGISAEGTRVMFDSDCDPASGNADGSVEVFRAGACVCGSPSTRQVSPIGPKASDALFALRAAVGSNACMMCECDVNNDANLGASDALRILKKAVSQPGVTLDCPAP